MESLLLIDPHGTLWRRAEAVRDDQALYVIGGVDPSTVRPSNMSTRAELTTLFGAPMREVVTPIGAAA